MAEKLLITIKDIQEYRPMADLVEARVDPYIREAQVNDLREFLGSPLYYDLITNTDTPANQDLLRGKTYTDPSTSKSIDFYGIVPMIVHYSLARIVMNNQINITSFGATSKIVPQSEPVSIERIKSLVTELNSIGVTYQNSAKKFLDDNLVTYPLWSTNTEYQSRETGMSFFKL